MRALRQKLPVSVTIIKNGAEESIQAGESQVATVMPSEITSEFAKYTPATKADVSEAIDAALKAKQAWQDLPFNDRAAIYLRAAELVSGKYRFELMAATMLGQGKNIWQAEIDAAAELADFYRFNVSFAEEIYSRQPTLNEPGQAGCVSGLTGLCFCETDINSIVAPTGALSKDSFMLYRRSISPRLVAI